MSTVDELLDSLARIGATIRPAGDRLILRAGFAAVPGELVRRIRQAKSELLAAVSSHDNERRYWHERFTALTFAWGAGKRDSEIGQAPRFGAIFRTSGTRNMVAAGPRGCVPGARSRSVVSIRSTSPTATGSMSSHSIA